MCVTVDESPVDTVATIEDDQEVESMVTEDVYDKLAEMIESEDWLGMPKTHALMKLLHLQYTPEEASLALHVTLLGRKLNEISERVGIEKGRLKEMLHTMARKGTMWIDPGKEDPTYRALGMAAPGLIETGVLGNIRFPYSVELGKTVHQVIRQWTELKMSRTGYLTPVWPAVAALPEDSDPSDNLLELVKGNDQWSVSFCPCRLSHWLDTPGDHCQHILETCMSMGDLSRFLVEYGMGRKITCDEAIEILRKCEGDGLVHTIYPDHAICNCCRDCCPYFISLHELGVRTLQPTNYLPQVDEEKCNACGTCADRCPTGAIEVNDVAVPNSDSCIGCGVCVVGCKPKAMSLVKRPEAKFLEVL